MPLYPGVYAIFSTGTSVGALDACEVDIVMCSMRYEFKKDISISDGC